MRFLRNGDLDTPPPRLVPLAKAKLVALNSAFHKSRLPSTPLSLWGFELFKISSQQGHWPLFPFSTTSDLGLSYFRFPLPGATAQAGQWPSQSTARLLPVSSGWKGGSKLGERDMSLLFNEGSNKPPSRLAK